MAVTGFNSQQSDKKEKSFVLQAGLVGRKKEARGVGSKEKPQGAARGRLRAAEQNKGATEKTEAWIPKLPKEQPDTKARLGYRLYKDSAFSQVV